MSGKRPRGRAVARPELWASYLAGILTETAFVFTLTLVAFLIALAIEAAL
jgi:hypothetical protein